MFLRVNRTAVAVAALLAACTAAPLALAETYHVPPAPIAQILDAAPTPQVSLSSDSSTLAILGGENLPSIAAVSEPILRLGGYRINPRTGGPIEARVAWRNALSFQAVAGGPAKAVALPAGLRFTETRWSPDGKTLAFVAETANGLELWAADVKTATARRVGAPGLNGAFGASYSWLPDGSGFLIRAVPAGRGPAPVASTTPEGPKVQETQGGKSAPVRTYQDLLSSPQDEALFAHYFTSQLTRVDLRTGATQAVGAPGLYTGASVSPDGRLILTTRVKPPFSYLVPAALFPTEIAVVDFGGSTVKTLVDRPLADNVPPPFDAVVLGPRNAEWRADAASTLVWVEAQDGGDPRNKAEVRDRVLMQDAPFTAAPRTLVDLDQRYAGVDWGRADAALVYTRWFNTRNEKRILVNPAQPGAGRVLIQRNYQDQYGDPGDIETKADGKGRQVIHFTPDGKSLFLAGEGAEAAGARPFLDRMTLADGKTQRLWRAQAGAYEPVVAIVDEAGRKLITRRESQSDAPNFFLRDLGGKSRALTSFVDPAPQFAGVSKQQITYTRADGVPLSGTLYLPAGYDPKRDGRLPLLMWAYPAEFTDAKVAGQTVDRSNRFTRPTGASHLFLLTQGYAVLDNPTMPIVGANGAEPNDTYVEQLVASAQAAVDKVVEMGVADRDRIAVGGHSYGAFMTANLLVHTDLFKTGIARSGAYNRTLTPFGFQSEQRTYWEAEGTYTRMSPFTYADKVNEPILLIHGEADDNSGTFPIQSERFYAALKGVGAQVRYVVLPNEAHGYRARESNLHTLWEMTTWLDRWLKPAAAPKAEK
ncbi:prolyl oligopeptidase family serine peptidase [Caulobacter sp. 17J65-9]|uniref:S9 family peptidase n=1 Tax=Caulobacter sp. 17J65-9 TaxID=2709382 RepID=UPI0013C7B39E|nr:prolyl oligopeptidase family serine peptidase [Caulobacter sp. 17J65-9]NEX94954.1 prolyl oligopeptidase family serine peptidase [Caulobacter sp. 17J65-9]